LNHRKYRIFVKLKKLLFINNCVVKDKESLCHQLRIEIKRK